MTSRPLPCSFPISSQSTRLSGALSRSPRTLCPPCGQSRARCSQAPEPAPGRPDSAFGQRLGGGLQPNEFAGAPPTGEAGWGEALGLGAARTSLEHNPGCQRDTFLKTKGSLPSPYWDPQDLPILHGSPQSSLVCAKRSKDPFAPRAPQALSSPFFAEHPGSWILELPARFPALGLSPLPRWLVALGEPGSAGRLRRGLLERKLGRGRQGRVSGQGAPSLLPPPLCSALVRVKLGGAGGAALTSLRAVPAREGGAEPLRARRSGAPPGAPVPPPPRLPLAALGHATVRVAAPGGRPELGLSLGTRLILGDRTTVTTTAPPPPSPQGAPAPSRVRKFQCLLRFGQASKEELGRQGGSLHQDSVRKTVGLVKGPGVSLRVPLGYLTGLRAFLDYWRDGGCALIVGQSLGISCKSSRPRSRVLGQ